MEIGKRYRIVFMIPGAKKPREAIFDCIGEAGNEYVFSARPLAGTQRIKKDAIMESNETNAKLKLPAIL